MRHDNSDALLLREESDTEPEQEETTEESGGGQEDPEPGPGPDPDEPPDEECLQQNSTERVVLPYPPMPRIVQVEG
jgi:hypothetical protein